MAEPITLPAHMTLRTVRLAALVLATAGALSCATLTSGEGAEPNYASDAETNLAKGNEALESKNFIEAERYFEHVKTKYPFLEAAKAAELKLADTEFEREKYLEARDGYQNFIKLHPTHAQVDYAAFRAALSHYKEMPSDLFILPPSEEKDQVEVRATYQAMADFLRQYPQSQYAPEAKEKMDEVRRRLADHELYVASFYRKREKWPAVIGRLRTVVEKYPGLGLEEDAYFGIYDAYLKLNDKAQAEQTLKLVIEKMPGTKAAQRAQKLLGQAG
jgi:outer membrane protein assembly factor BamD